MTIQRYHRPTDLRAAWNLLEEGGERAALLGGGTDLVVACPPQVRELIDLADAGLSGIHLEDGALRIGAMATFTELLEHPAVAGHATGVLAEMLVHVGSVLHRNTATIGGHLARARMSDVIGVLVALDAIVVMFDGASTEVPLTDYLDGWDSPHVITEVRLPALPGGAGEASAAAFTRFSRTAFDHAVLTCCGRIDLAEGRVAAARLTLSEPAAVGRRVAAGEDVLQGASLDALRDGGVVEAAARAVTDHLDVHGDWATSAEYRRHLAGVAVRRVLATVVERLDR